MSKDFESGYCKECKKYQKKVIVSGILMATSTWDYIEFVDFIVEGDSVSRLNVNSTKSTEDNYKRNDIVDQQIRVKKFCEDLEMGDCPDCGNPIPVPWFKK